MMKEQNSELRTAWDFVENTGRSIFLTGKEYHPSKASEEIHHTGLKWKHMII